MENRSHAVPERRTQPARDSHGRKTGERLPLPGGDLLASARSGGTQSLSVLRGKYKSTRPEGAPLSANPRFALRSAGRAQALHWHGTDATGPGLYPQGLTREQVEQYVKDHPEK